MLVQEIVFQLNDGRSALLRSPREEEAEEMRQFIITASGQTEFLLTYPEEFDDFSVEQEREWLRSSVADPNCALIACYIDGKIAGNCQISFRPSLKERHRASVAISLLEEFWGLGIGSRMFEELIQIAQARPHVRQMELDFIEGNARARGLYEKMGFRITGVKPDAIRLKDGTYLNEYMMVKRLYPSAPML